MLKRQHTSERMSRIVTHNDTIYLCGQVADNRSADIKVQTLQTLNKIENLLSEANSDKNHLLSVTIYLKNMNDFAEMNKVWESWLNPTFAPARACVKAEMASSELLIEMSVVAAGKIE